jgi:signal transduction histidine kinase
MRPLPIVHRRWSSVVDLLVATALAVLGEVELFSGATYDNARLFPGPRWANAVLIVAMCAPLLVRRSHPTASTLTVLAVLSSGAVVYGGQEAATAFVLLIVTVFSGAAYSSRPAWIAAAAAGAVVVHDLTDQQIHGIGDVIFAAALAAVAGVLGRAVHRRQHTIGRLQREAGRAEQQHAEQVATATAAERAAIARELHDIVAHAVSVIVIQAQAGQLALPEQPDTAADVLAVIESTGRGALNELRLLLTLLGTEKQAGTEVSPMPSISQVGSLLESVRAAGLDVELDGADDLPALPAPTELAVYRVVQESLTNAMKHAAGAPARITMARRGSRLDVVVANGPARTSHNPVPTGSGRGLIGMRQRLELVGGSLDHGPHDGGYVVRAAVPIPPVEDAS